MITPARLKSFRRGFSDVGI